jgi:hypothetical protein
MKAQLTRDRVYSAVRLIGSPAIILGGLGPIVAWVSLLAYGLSALIGHVL